MTNQIDTSPEAIAALLDGVTPGPWVAESGHTQQNGQLYWQVSNEYDAIMQNQFCWAQGDPAANARFIAAARDLVPALAAEIARLTADLRHVMSERDRTFALMLDRAEKAEAERDEARAQVRKLNAIITRNPSGTICDACRATGAYHCTDAFYGCSGMRDYTLEEASAALAARDAAMRNEGRRQAAEIARADAQSETGPILRRRLAGNGTPIAASARRRQAIRTTRRILAALEPEGGE